MKRILIALIVVAVACSNAFAIEVRPAKWNHALYSTQLANSKPGEYQVFSFISTGMSSSKSVRHAAEVMVSSWDKEFMTTLESKDKKIKETFSVILRTTDNPKEMIAVFEHVVYDNGKLMVKFSGQTILTR